jgi:PIN domain nuclease of toxin-antitoxin system
MTDVLADTHVIIWLLTEPGQLSAAAAKVLKDATDANWPIRISVISLVEMLYLVEKGRINSATLADLSDLLGKSDSPFELLPVDLKVYEALPKVARSAVPDFPDRIIAATAISYNLVLVARDRRILDAGPGAIEA